MMHGAENKTLVSAHSGSS